MKRIRTKCVYQIYFTVKVVKTKFENTCINNFKRSQKTEVLHHWRGNVGFTKPTSDICWSSGEHFTNLPLHVDGESFPVHEVEKTKI